MKLTTDKVVVLDRVPTASTSSPEVETSLPPACLREKIRDVWYVILVSSLWTVDRISSLVTGTTMPSRYSQTPGSSSTPLEGKGTGKENSLIPMVLPFLILAFCLYCLVILIIVYNCSKMFILFVFYYCLIIEL